MFPRLKCLSSRFVLPLAALASAQVALAQAPFTYQGRLKTAAGPVTGATELRFRLFDAATGGNQLGTEEVENFASLSDGQFTVTLNEAGNFGASAFDGNQRWLELRVNGALLSPRVQVTPTPYGYYSYNTRGLNVDANDNVGFGVASGGSRIDAVSSAANPGATIKGVNTATSGVTNGIFGEARSTSGTAVLGRAAATSGNTFGIYGTNTSNSGTGVFGETAASVTTGVNARGVWGRTFSTQGIGVWGTAVATTGTNYGVFGRSDSSSGIAVFGHATSASGVTYGVRGRADSAAGYAGYFEGRLTASNVIESLSGGFKFPDGSIQVTAAAGGGCTPWSCNSGDIYNTNTGNITFNAGGLLRARMRLDADSLDLLEGPTTEIEMRSSYGAPGSGSWVGLKDDGAERITFSANYLNALGGGGIELKDDFGVRAQLYAGNGGAIRLFHPNNANTVYINANEPVYGSGELFVKRDGQNNGVVLHGRVPNIDEAGAGLDLHLPVTGANSMKSIEMRAAYTSAFPGGWACFRALGPGNSQQPIDRVCIAAESNAGGSSIELKNQTGSPTVVLRGDTGNGFGRVTTSVLEITGGSDLAEPFDIAGDTAQPGTVVSIDPDRPGKLRVSDKAYDHTVAGVISGAGGVSAGMVMGHQGTLADGKHAVALSGRVYVWCDASSGAIQPGDLLTTSDVAGHAMKAIDRSAAPGATIGKAMTRLESGRGLVLVLVNLQ